VLLIIFQIHINLIPKVISFLTSKSFYYSFSDQEID